MASDGTATVRPLRLQVPAPVPAVPAPGTMGDASGVASRITLTNRSILVDGVPWLPVMGEYHFSRDDEQVWSTELRKMRANGITVLATYVLWILHEPCRGVVDWTGNRDLRRFIRLADDAGLKVVLRIGPWAHGETRNGGFPDWVQELPVRHRTNDDQYLAVVRDWYGEIAHQVRDLTHSANRPAAPIIGIQVDNELYDQPDHLDMLRTIAESEGLTASIWAATGWGGAQLPDHRLMPLYAGYSDGFWEQADVDWPAFGPMHFTFNALRDDLSVGADLRPDAPVAQRQDEAFPFATCELGGGMHVAYHRRPRVDPEDVAALALTKLGSGSSWQGYYLFHGVTQQVAGKISTQESHATGYPNDLSERDYDFGAPIGSAGQIRPHAHLLRMQHLFIEEWGSELADMPSTVGDADSGVRWAVRAATDRGFLFVNNHQPRSTLPAQRDVQFAVELADMTVTVPTRPFTVPADSFFIWPIRMPLGSLCAVTATAQPVTAVHGDAGHLIVLAATPGVPVELLVEGMTGDITGAAVERIGEAGALLRPDREPGQDCRVSVGDTVFLVLDRHAATRLWNLGSAAAPDLVIWDGGAIGEGEIELDSASAQTAPVSIDSAGHLQPLLVPTVAPLPAPRMYRDGSAMPSPVPARSSGAHGRASGPIESDWVDSALFHLELPDLALRPDERLMLSIEWTGDAARLLIDGTLVADQFWSGRPWQVDITREHRSRDVVIQLLPWAFRTAVYVDPRVRPVVERAPLAISDVQLSLRRPHHL